VARSQGIAHEESWYRMTTVRACFQLLRCLPARRRAGVVLAVLLASSLAACGGSSSTGGDGAQGTPATTTLASTFGKAAGPVSHINWGLPFGEPDTINPPYSTYYSSMFTAAQMCDTLVRMKPDFSKKPGLATVTQPDPKTVEIELRKGVKFWNGNEITSADVKYVLESDVKSPNVGLYFASIGSIDATSRYHVTVRLKTPDERLIKQLSTFSGMVYEKKFAVRAGKSFGSSGGGIMCSGPYELSKWNPGTSIELKANPNYWDPEYQPHAKTVSLKFFNGSTSLAAALVAGEIDGAYEVPAQTIPKLSTAKSGKLHYGPSLQFWSLNHARPGGTLASPKLRQALFMTIDRDALAKVVFHGAAVPSYTVAAPSAWDPEAKDQWAQAYQPYEQAGKKFGSPDAVAEAKKLVSASGYTGAPVVLTILAGDVTSENIAQLVQQQGSQIGLKVKINPLTAIKFTQATYDANARGNSDLLLLSSFQQNKDPLEVTPYFTLPDQAYNYSNYSDPTVTKLMGQALRTVDPAERVALEIKAQDIYEKAYEFLTPVYANQISFLNNNLSGMTTSFAYAYTPSLALIGAAG
jgi:peptide/nickel transport system substrate-binding protein